VCCIKILKMSETNQMNAIYETIDCMFQNGDRYGMENWTKSKTERFKKYMIEYFSQPEIIKEEIEYFEEQDEEEEDIMTDFDKLICNCIEQFKKEGLFEDYDETKLQRFKKYVMNTEEDDIDTLCGEQFYIEQMKLFEEEEEEEEVNGVCAGCGCEGKYLRDVNDTDPCWYCLDCSSV